MKSLADVTPPVLECPESFIVYESPDVLTDGELEVDVLATDDVAVQSVSYSVTRRNSVEAYVEVTASDAASNEAVCYYAVYMAGNGAHGSH